LLNNTATRPQDFPGAGMENTANVPAPATACARAAKPLCEPCADRCLPGKPHRVEKENGARLPQTAHLRQHVVVHPDTALPCMPAKSSLSWSTA